jgi:MFS family permease
VAAALIAGAQIAGGLATPWIRRLFRRRTSMLMVTLCLSALAVLLIALIQSFWAALALITVWGLLSAAVLPVRQAYLNGLIPSRQRATILSFDSLMSSTGGVIAQPGLGRSADVWGYPASYAISAALSALAVPFIALSRRQDAPADTRIDEAEPATAVTPG